MAAYVGTAMDIKWLAGAGTTTMSGDYRTFTYTPSIDLVEETAGGDAAKLYVAAQKDGQISFSSLVQSGTGAGGTVMATACVEGQIGTLIFSPDITDFR